MDSNFSSISSIMSSTSSKLLLILQLIILKIIKPYFGNDISYVISQYIYWKNEDEDNEKY